jgi:hypothetical protein
MLRLLALALLILVVSGSALTPAPSPTTGAIFEVIADGLGSARGIVVDDDDRVYVADREAGTVTRFEAGSRRVIARRLDRPIGLALDRLGRVLVAEERGGATRLLGACTDPMRTAWQRLAAHGSAVAEELASELAWSLEDARRALDELAGRGLVMRARERYLPLPAA